MEKSNVSAVIGGAFSEPSTASTLGLTELTPFQRAIVRQIALGSRQKAIAEEFGVTSQTVGKLMKSPAARRYLEFLGLGLDEQVLEAQRQTMSHVPAAIDVTAQIMHDPNANDRDRLVAASSFVDRALPKAARQDAAGKGLPKLVFNLNFAPEQVRQLKSVLQPESELEAIEDVDFEIVAREETTND